MQNVKGQRHGNKYHKGYRPFNEKEMGGLDPDSFYLGRKFRVKFVAGRLIERSSETRVKHPGLGGGWSRESCKMVHTVHTFTARPRDVPSLPWNEEKYLWDG